MKKSIGGIVFDVANGVFLIIFALICIIPFLTILSGSFVGAEEFFKYPIILIPKYPTTVAYLFLFSSQWIFNGFRISLIVTIVGTFWTLFINSTVAYALSSENLPGKKFFMLFFIVPSYIQGGLIPSYWVIANVLRIDNTILPLCVCYGVSVFTFLLFKSFFKDIPKSLIESARIDGAGEYTILFRIILPLSKPIFATLTLFATVQFWNEWFNAKLYMRDDTMYPLQLILRQLIVEDSMGSRAEEIRKIIMMRYNIDSKGIFNIAVKYSVIVVTSLPIMFVFPFLSKYFSKGITMGSIKK